VCVCVCVRGARARAGILMLSFVCLVVGNDCLERLSADRQRQVLHINWFFERRVTTYCIGAYGLLADVLLRQLTLTLTLIPNF